MSCYIPQIKDRNCIKHRHSCSIHNKVYFNTFFFSFLYTLIYTFLTIEILFLRRKKKVQEKIALFSTYNTKRLKNLPWDWSSVRFLRNQFPLNMLAKSFFDIKRKGCIFFSSPGIFFFFFNAFNTRLDYTLTKAMKSSLCTTSPAGAHVIICMRTLSPN